MALKFFLCLVLLFFMSCNKEDVERVSTDVCTPILFDIVGVEDQSGTSRGLIETTQSLQHACKPADQNGGGQSIGLWADRMEGNETEFNILGNNTSIIYNPNVQGGNPYNSWNYEGEAKLWRDSDQNPDNGILDKGVYKFRAYYPKSVNVVESSDATHFVVDYNTALMQEDLLVAYKLVDASVFDLYTPVPLRFKHALAAVRFQMKFKEGYMESDALTSFWLQNGTSQDFSYIGMMVYGLFDEHTQQVEPEGIEWTESAQRPWYQKMYHWENSKGVPFENKEGVQTVATAYTDEVHATHGELFSKNNGWVLIIPQKSPGTVTMNFTTQKGGSSVYTIQLPKITGTDEKGENPSGEYYLPGYRYTYTVTLTKTHADVTLGIAPWNELDSSFDIPY